LSNPVNKQAGRQTDTGENMNPLGRCNEL